MKNRALTVRKGRLLVRTSKSWMVRRVPRTRNPNPGRIGFLWCLVTTEFFLSNSGVLTPVDPPSVAGSAVIAVDQAMEVDKAELIPIKQVVCVLAIGDYEELI